MPNLSKVVEHLLTNQLSMYLSDIRFFDNSQYGFLRHSRCLAAALELVEEICLNFKEKYTACLFVDLKKAFDTVDTNRLVLKMKQLGLADVALRLMGSYLNNRQTATGINENKSSFKTLNVGVAQGSKLGPLHFILYVNDMTRLNLHGKLILYADDAVLLYTCDSMKELNDCMQRDIDLLSEWLVNNVLTMNAFLLWLE